MEKDFKPTTEEQSAKESEIWESFVTRNYNEGISLVSEMSDDDIINLLNELDAHELELEKERQATRIKKSAIRAFVSDRKKHLSKAIKKESDKIFSSTLGMKKSTDKKIEERKKMTREERMADDLAGFGVDLAEFRAELAAVKTPKKTDDEDNVIAKLAENK
jgi:hypothetical protein